MAAKSFITVPVSFFSFIFETLPFIYSTMSSFPPRLFLQNEPFTVIFQELCFALPSARNVLLPDIHMICSHILFGVLFKCPLLRTFFLEYPSSSLAHLFFFLALFNFSDINIRTYSNATWHHVIYLFICYCLVSHTMTGTP